LDASANSTDEHMTGLPGSAVTERQNASQLAGKIPAIKQLPTARATATAKTART
jgi:hypothetical protein